MLFAFFGGAIPADPYGKSDEVVLELLGCFQPKLDLVDLCRKLCLAEWALSGSFW